MRTKMRTVTRHRLCIGGMYGLIVIVMGAMFSETFLNMLARWAAVVAVALGVAGCSTTNYTPTTPLYEIEEAKHAADTALRKAAAPQVSVLPPVASSTAFIRHGRFIVEMSENKHVIQGGVFTPPALLSQKTSEAHLLVVDYSTKELLYYRRIKTGSYEPIIGYAVVTPKPEELPAAEVRGNVTRIDTRPTWCPGKEARKKYPKLPAGCLPFGHVDNAMGVAKFEIKWQSVKGWEAVRLHGAIGYSTTGAFWNEETLGCTRLEDTAILKLIELLGPYAVKEGIEVILERGNTLQKHAL